MRSILLSIAIVSFSVLNLGCIHDEWTYRVARDMRVMESDSALRAGALTLVPAGAATASTPAPAPLSNAMLQQKMTQREKAKTDLAQLESKFGPDHSEVKQQKQLVVALEAEIGHLTQQAAARQSVSAITGKPKTVLVVSLNHSGPGSVTTKFGTEMVDRYSRMFVMFLDQPLPNETVWATDENSMLIDYSPLTKPERVYVGVEGSVKIVSVNGDEIVADVSLKIRSDMEEMDATLFRFPYSVRGRHQFTTLAAKDPILRSGALRIGSIPTVSTVPTTQPSVATTAGQ